MATLNYTEASPLIQVPNSLWRPYVLKPGSFRDFSLLCQPGCKCQTKENKEQEGKIRFGPTGHLIQV